MNLSTPTITRKQLRNYGASRYLARRLTVSLLPVAKSGNAHVYAVDKVSMAIRKYGSKARIQLTTREVLEQILSQLLAQLDNVLPLVPSTHTTEVSSIARQLFKQMRRTDRALSEMKATVASIGERTS